MADREFELRTGSNMGSSDLEFGPETGHVRGLADKNWPTILAWDLIQTRFAKPRELKT